jgi:hypothetical protein
MGVAIAILRRSGGSGVTNGVHRAG